MDTYVGVRCRCGKVLGNKQANYQQMLQEGKTPEQALNALGLTRYCCRTGMLAPGQLPLGAGMPTTLTTTLGSLPQNVVGPRIYSSSIGRNPEEKKLPSILRGGTHVGVIPKIWDGRQWLYGLSRDPQHGNLADFGGSMDTSDADLPSGALREFAEKTNRVFGFLDTTDAFVLDGHIGKRRWYLLIVSVPGTPEEYRQNSRDLVWLTEEDLLRKADVQIWEPFRRLVATKWPGTPL